VDRQPSQFFLKDGKESKASSGEKEKEDAPVCNRGRGERDSMEKKSKSGKLMKVPWQMILPDFSDGVELFTPPSFMNLPRVWEVACLPPFSPRDSGEANPSPSLSA